MIIYRDTREQRKLEFEIGDGVTQVIDIKLPYGDYACGYEDKNGSHLEFMPLFWERKGLGDLFGTLTSGIERFKKEIERAKEDGVALTIIIEGCRREVEMGYENSTISGNTILKTLDTLHVKHGIEHVFCNDRKDMVKTIVSKFNAIGRNFKPKGKGNEGDTKSFNKEDGISEREREAMVEQSRVAGLRDAKETELE